MHSTPTRDDKTGARAFKTDRVYSLWRGLSEREAAEKLVGSTFVLCLGFALERDGVELLVLNDATSEDGAAEWAMILVDARWETETLGTQIETITFGWIDDVEEALGHIDACFEIAAAKRERPMNRRVLVQTTPEGEDHECELCR